MKPAFSSCSVAFLTDLPLTSGTSNVCGPLLTTADTVLPLGILPASRLLADDAAGLDGVVELLGGLELELGVFHHVACFVDGAADQARHLDRFRAETDDESDGCVAANLRAFGRVARDDGLGRDLVVVLLGDLANDEVELRQLGGGIRERLVDEVRHVVPLGATRIARARCGRPCECVRLGSGVCSRTNPEEPSR